MTYNLNNKFLGLIAILVVIFYVGEVATSTIAQENLHANQPNQTIYLLEWQPDGNKLAMGSLSEVWVYTTTMEEVGHIQPGKVLTSIAWSPDGNSLALLMGDGLGKGWELQIWRINVTPIDMAFNVIEQNTPNNIPIVEWNSTGSLLAVSFTQQVQIRNATTGHLLTTISGFPFEVSGIAWNPELGQNELITSSLELLQLWDADTGNLLRTLSNDGDFAEITWQPESNLIAVAANLQQDIQIWNISTYQFVKTLQGHTHTISDLEWGTVRLASSSFDGTVVIWDTDENRILTTINAGNEINAIAWSPDGDQLAYAGRGGLIQLEAISETCSATQSVSSGDVSGLITAINAANANPDADVIGLAAGTYTFTSINNNRNALPRITTDITICSADGATLTRATSAPQFRFFEVRSTGNLTLQNLTLTNGSLGVDDDGGAIFNLGTLAVNDVTFSNNQAGVGGAIASEGTQVTVMDSTFTNNTSTGDGGAIHSEADLLIENSTFTGNTADDAGAVNNDGGNLTVTDSTFSDNSADDGGAIYNDAGIITLSGSTFTNNTGDAGGALDNLDGQAQIDSSSFTGNSASDGGAIRNYGGTVILTTSRFTGNMATDDGGALNNSGGTLTITDTRLENNTATTRGGAIYSNSSGTMSAHNSCILGNSATAVYAASTGLQDFTGNWWGAANGPGGAGPGSGDTINSKINHANFLTADCPLP